MDGGSGVKVFVFCWLFLIAKEGRYHGYVIRWPSVRICSLPFLFCISSEKSSGFESGIFQYHFSILLLRIAEQDLYLRMPKVFTVYFEKEGQRNLCYANPTLLNWFLSPTLSKIPTGS